MFCPCLSFSCCKTIFFFFSFFFLHCVNSLVVIFNVLSPSSATPFLSVTVCVSFAWRRSMELRLLLLRRQLLNILCHSRPQSGQRKGEKTEREREREGEGAHSWTVFVCVCSIEWFAFIITTTTTTTTTTTVAAEFGNGGGRPTWWWRPCQAAMAVFLSVHTTSFNRLIDSLYCVCAVLFHSSRTK